MKINHAVGLRENKPNQTQFQRQKMLLRLTTNGRVDLNYFEIKQLNLRVDLGYVALCDTPNTNKTEAKMRPTIGNKGSEDLWI